MDERLRDSIRERFGHRCAYCGVHEDDAGATLTIDHHRPRVRGGEEQGENLVYACARCNEHKGSYWHEHDPPHVRLLHPGRDEITTHLREDDDGRIVGTTPEGAFFVRRLRLNRPQLIAYRRGVHLRRKLSEDLTAALGQMRVLEQRMELLDKAIVTLADELERD
ncbi:MAG: HNH endonuclease [Minicystis sp.]